MPSDKRSIWVGYDPRPVEVASYVVAQSSIQRRLHEAIPIYCLALGPLLVSGLYKRPTERDEQGRLWDVISDAPMSTEFAISRFLVPHLAKTGWALFVDGDVMARASLTRLFEEADPSKACMVVKHDYTPTGTHKMDGQFQTTYPRKNWSSVVLWNCEHPGAQYLTPEVVNSVRGLHLHQFAWLDDADIGELDPRWNHLVGEHEHNPMAALVHFTNGCPIIPGRENCAFADEWRAERERLIIR